MLRITRAPFLLPALSLGGDAPPPTLMTGDYRTPKELQSESGYGYTEAKCKKYREGANREAMNEKEYWECSSADCNVIRQMIADGQMTDADCRARGGEGENPCTYLVHSCFSTVVCQVMNYMYGEGQFTQECGQYGEWVAQFTSGLWDWVTSLFRCAFDKDDRPAFVRLSERAAELNEGNRSGYEASRQILIQAWNDKRKQLGLPEAEPYVAFEFLQNAIMLSRGEVPSLDVQVVDLVNGVAQPHKPKAILPPIGGGVRVPMDDAILEYSLLGDRYGLWDNRLDGVDKTAKMKTGSTVRAGQFSPYSLIGSRWKDKLLPPSRPFRKTTWPDGTPINEALPVTEFVPGPGETGRPFDPFLAISTFLEGNCLTCGPSKCGGSSHDADMSEVTRVGGNVLSALWDKYHRAATVVMGLLMATAHEEWLNAHPDKRPRPGGPVHIISLPKRPAGSATGASVKTYPCPKDHPSYVLFGQSNSASCKPEVAGGNGYPVYTATKQRTPLWKCINGSVARPKDASGKVWVCGAPKTWNLVLSNLRTSVTPVKRITPSAPVSRTLVPVGPLRVAPSTPPTSVKPVVVPQTPPYATYALYGGVALVAIALIGGAIWYTSE